jgi:hypothetical protein
MRWRHANAEDGARIVRLAWLASFLATLMLIGILAIAKSAQAFTVVDPGAPGPTVAAALPFTPELEEEDEEEEFEAEECEEEAEEECGEEAGLEAPPECLISSAQATVFASSGQDKLRLVLRYTAASPTAAVIGFGLHGSKGSLFLGESKKQLSKAGVIRETEVLGEPQMAKVIAAKDFTVQLYAVQAPHFCRHYFDRHLTVRHAAPSGLIWADPEASLRPSSKS